MAERARAEGRRDAEVSAPDAVPADRSPAGHVPGLRGGGGGGGGQGAGARPRGGAGAWRRAPRGGSARDNVAPSSVLPGLRIRAQAPRLREVSPLPPPPPESPEPSPGLRLHPVPGSAGPRPLRRDHWWEPWAVSPRPAAYSLRESRGRVLLSPPCLSFQDRKPTPAPPPPRPCAAGHCLWPGCARRPTSPKCTSGGPGCHSWASPMGRADVIPDRWETKAPRGMCPRCRGNKETVDGSSSSLKGGESHVVLERGFEILRAAIRTRPLVACYSYGHS